MIKTYGVKPDEQLAYNRLLPRQREAVNWLLRFTEISFAAAVEAFTMLAEVSKGNE